MKPPTGDSREVNVLYFNGKVQLVTDRIVPVTIAFTKPESVHPYCVGTKISGEQWILIAIRTEDKETIAIPMTAIRAMY